MNNFFAAFTAWVKSQSPLIKTVETFAVALAPPLYHLIQTGGMPTTADGWINDVWQAAVAAGLLHFPSMSAPPVSATEIAAVKAGVPASVATAKTP